MCGKNSSVGKIASFQQISKLIEGGHELGCHTYSHVDAWTEPYGDFEKSLDLNESAFKKEFPTVILSSFAYPKGSATGKVKKIIEKRFVTGRGIYWGINVKKVDANLLNACELYCRGKESSVYKRCIQTIDRCIREKGWSIFFTHDISDSPGPFGCTHEVLHSLIEYCINNGVAVKPVREIIKEP
jgi:peptidoglycan/xylan/chitin deacetylase (PgdA/CDA1 family)